MEENKLTNEELKYCYKYPHPSVTTDCVIFGFDGTKLSVLLVKRGVEPYKGRWAFPGGFMNMDESAEEELCASCKKRRGLKERIFVSFTPSPLLSVTHVNASSRLLIMLW